MRLSASYQGVMIGVKVSKGPKYQVISDLPGIGRLRMNNDSLHVTDVNQGLNETGSIMLRSVSHVTQTCRRSRTNYYAYIVTRDCQISEETIFVHVL